MMLIDRQGTRTPRIQPQKIRPEPARFAEKPTNTIMTNNELGSALSDALNKTIALTDDAEITEEEFQSYVTCQRSGATNMFDTRMVGMITGLSKPKILKIMREYGALKAKYEIK
jgi:hypothetical protein